MLENISKAFPQVCSGDVDVPPVLRFTFFFSKVLMGWRSRPLNNTQQLFKGLDHGNPFVICSFPTCVSFFFYTSKALPKVCADLFKYCFKTSLISVGKWQRYVRFSPLRKQYVAPIKRQVGESTSICFCFCFGYFV